MPFLAPLVTAVSTWWAGTAVGSFLATVGITGSMILTAGINVAAGLIEKAIAKKNEPPGGVQFEKQYGENPPRQVPIGRVAMAGHDCYVNTYDSGNGRIQQVYALGDYYCDGLSRVAINGTWETLGSTPDPERGLPVVSGEFTDLIWIKFVDGTQIVADANLVEEANPADRWSEAHVGLGICHVIVSMIFDTEKNNSPPDFFFEFRGARLYDWRKDSTAGGSGTHRWGDYSTHEYTANPIVAEYNYRRGFTINDDLFCGMEMPASDLPFDKWTAAANLCDELVAKEDGSFEPRYQLSLLLDCTRSHGDNIDSIMLSCGGMTIDAVDGAWPLVGSDQPVVATITDDDFIAGAPFQFQAKRSMSDLVNSVSGNSPDPDQLWSMVGYEAQISDTALVVDRRTRDVNIDFPMVPSARQAGQLAGIYLEENRWEATVSGMLRPRWQVLEAGDWVRYNSQKYGDLTFMMTESSLASLDADGPRNAQVSLQQRDGSIYDGILNPPVIVPAPPGAPDYQSELENYHLIPIIVQTETGSQRAALRASWNVITDVTISEIEFQYRPVAQPDAVMGETATSDQTVAQLTAGVISLSAFEARYRLHSDPPRTIPWTDWVQVTTLDARLVGADFYPIDLDQLAQDVKAFQAWTGNAVRDVLEQLQAVSTNSAGNFLVGFSDKQELRRELRSTTDGAVALFTEEIITATGPGSALALKIQALEATVNDPVTGVVASSTAVSSLSTTVSAQGGTIAANASAIIALQTTVGDVSAGSTFRMGTDYTPAAGWSSRIGIEARVTSGSTFRSSGLYIEATASASRIVLDTDQFVIMAGGVVTALFDAGTAFIATARIRNLTAGNITANSLNAGLVLQNGTVITSLIAGNAITDWDNQAFFLSTGANGPSFVTRATITVNNTGAIPPLVFARMNSVYTAGGGSSSATVNMRLVRTVGGVDTVLRSVTYNSNSGVYEPVFLDAAAPAGTFTYRIDTNHTPAGGAGITIDCSVTANWWKK
ncbi:phage tail protein [Mesorhizobium sp. B2-5-3]|uniref:phage tail protein n=1 Tax=Mesorhizobium sp. B2-5-3 TaxID=2589927 RepID=UPI00112EC25E|nr:phage tail protein [Mesorhizobium sp. B2-5-3]TPK38706.1 hypothetical protein FJ867_08865 [Mesorhizobium sp. B2-5-3]